MPLGGVKAQMSLNTNAMDRLGPYTVESPIGSGSFGDIYLARTPEGKLVVIKKSKKREGMDAMWHERAFDTEARALHLIAGNYDGHNIVRLLDHVRTPYASLTFFESHKSIFEVQFRIQHFTNFHSFKLASF